MKNLYKLCLLIKKICSEIEDFAEIEGLSSEDYLTVICMLAEKYCAKFDEKIEDVFENLRNLSLEVTAICGRINDEY